MCKFIGFEYLRKTFQAFLEEKLVLTVNKTTELWNGCVHNINSHVTSIKFLFADFEGPFSLDLTVSLFKLR